MNFDARRSSANLGTVIWRIDAVGNKDLRIADPAEVLGSDCSSFLREDNVRLETVIRIEHHKSYTAERTSVGVIDAQRVFLIRGIDGR